MNKRIREQRKRAGLTIKQVADRIDRSPGQLSKLENGKLNFTVDWLLALSKCYGCPVTDLLPPEYTVAAPPDTKLLGVCIRAVLEEVDRSDGEPRPEEIAHLTAALYQEMSKLGEVAEHQTVVSAVVSALVIDPRASPQT